MFRFLCLWAALLLMSVSAQADITITKPQVSGPIRLVCLNPNQLVGMVRSITRQQVIGIRYVARDGQLHRGCDDVRLPVGTQSVHERWIQTRDGWWVLGQTVRYPNDVLMVTVDPLQATYGRQPIQFQRYYGGYFVPIIPGYNNRVIPAPVPYRNHRSQPRPHRSTNPDMTIEQGQEFLRQELKRLGR